MKISLLPEPQHLTLTEGAFILPEQIRIFLSSADRPAFEAAKMLANLIRTRTGKQAMLDRRGLAPTAVAKSIELECETSSSEEAYRLTISTNGIRIVGRGKPGLFYGLQTLMQLIEDKGGRLPCLTIEDAPAFRARGYYLDVSRGKAPRLETLYRLIDLLAALKINQFQLYVEHVFDFKFDPSIGEGCCPLTSEDILALDRYCRDRYIELVPSMTCFGHMGRVLSLPQYRHLAEIEWPAKDWNSSEWIQRLRGATINPLHPESKQLLARMLDDFLPLFSSGRFNLCGDETYDLGRGVNAARAARTGLGKLYLEHIRFVRKTAAKYGKKVMFWGDVIQHNPDAAPDIPKDCIVLDWGYEPETRFEKIQLFLDEGLETYVCPSVRGYKVVFNDVERARANIAGYALAGQRLGAAGLLNTDWGDMGHFNMAGCSLHGLALGAAMAWNPVLDEHKAFDQAFSRQLFGDANDRAARLFSLAGSTGFSKWPFLAVSQEPPAEASGLREKARRLQTDLMSWAEEFRSRKPTRLVSSLELEQLALGCEAVRLNVDWFLLSLSKQPSKDQTALNTRMKAFDAAFSNLWNQLNRPCGLNELRERVFAKFI
ncbi:MAG TPA: hypothetical protein DCZ95_02720 [Verrucomicrobia bacterium]|nr:MAG: hypothetical protein A2X46_03640 [Lentisphaerae bacterium GWF2_57_35]HBA82985.1 hypothetical protein [Verrucomicrobiota bacterium]